MVALRYSNTKHHFHRPPTGHEWSHSDNPFYFLRMFPIKSVPLANSCPRLRQYIWAHRLARVVRSALVCEVNNHTVHDLVTQHCIGEGLYPSVASLNHR